MVQRHNKEGIAVIVDIHTHLIDYDSEMDDNVKEDIARCFRKNTWIYTPEDLIRDTAAADKVFIFGIRAKATGWFSDNERVARFTETSPRFIFVASIDPLDEDYPDQLTYVHKTLGAKMLKLGPIYQGVHPHDKKYHHIYEYCQKNNLPIITHMATTFTSGVPLEFAKPILMDEIAYQYPDLKIILAHMGHPWEPETIATIRRHKNLFADISALYYRPWQFYNSMRLLEEYMAEHKVFFGSDYPATTTQESIDGLRNINNILKGTSLPTISNELIETIIHSNPFELLGIEAKN